MITTYIIGAVVMFFILIYVESNSPSSSLQYAWTLIAIGVVLWPIMAFVLAFSWAMGKEGAN